MLFRSPVDHPVCISILDDDAPALVVAKLTQPLPERGEEGIGGRALPYHSDPGNPRRLLRLGDGRRREQAARSLTACGWQRRMSSPRLDGDKGGRMLNPGDKAPDFTGRDHTGKTVKLSDFKGKTVVLWFYPKADTPG